MTGISSLIYSFKYLELLMCAFKNCIGNCTSNYNEHFTQMLMLKFQKYSTDLLIT